MGGCERRATAATGLAILAALLCLAGCEESGELPQDVELVTLEGAVLDPVVDDAGVPDAWIIVDTGDELISVRSGADGTFSIPDVPEDRAIALTVAAEDRRAIHDGAIVLADEELPLEISCAYRDLDYYDFPTMKISGTVSGAPVGSYLFFNGPDYWGEEYIQVESGAPVPYQFTVEVIGDRETYTFAAMAFDGNSGEILGATAATVDVAGTAEADLEWGSGGNQDLLITTNQPVLDGAPLEELDDSEALANLSLIMGGETADAILGWAEGWEAVADGFEIDAWYTPVVGYDHAVTAFLTDDIMGDGPFAYGRVPLEAGAATVHVDVLDAPALDDHGDFGPDTTLSWGEVDGADRYTVYVLEDDMLAMWLLTDTPEVTFPRLPEDFDTSLIAGDDGQWHVRVSQYAEDEDDEIDYSHPYLVSETPGGDLVW